MKTAKQLPLFLGVQAALVVLVLPTQEECDTLQPSQAKPSQASFVFSLGSVLALRVNFCRLCFPWLSSGCSSEKRRPDWSRLLVGSVSRRGGACMFNPTHAAAARQFD